MIETREQKPPLAAIGQQREALAARPQPAEPGGRHVAAAAPGSVGAAEAADALQHERDEGRNIAAAVEDGAATLPQLLRGVVVKGRRQISGERIEPRGVQQQAAVMQILPAGQGMLRGPFIILMQEEVQPRETLGTAKTN